MAKGKAAGWVERRRCPFCRGYFQPNLSRPNQRFCKAECQKAFWQHGGAATEKLILKCMRAVDARAQEQWERLQSWIAEQNEVRAAVKLELDRVQRLRAGMERLVEKLKSELRYLGVKTGD